MVVMAPPALRLALPLAIPLSELVVNLHVVPTCSVENTALSSKSVTELILGSVPANLSYVTCRGSVSVRGVSLPLLQDSSLTLAAVMAPIRSLSTFGMVLEWSFLRV